MEKVYCNDCVHHGFTHNCYHKDNIYYIDTPTEQELRFVHWKELNLDNRCSKYKKGDRYSILNVVIRSFTGNSYI